MDKTHISAEDLALFQKASQTLQQAQAIMQFVANHLETSYGISGQDTFDLRTGEIARAKESAE